MNDDFHHRFCALVQQDADPFFRTIGAIEREGGGILCITEIAGDKGIFTFGKTIEDKSSFPAAGLSLYFTIG